MIITSPPLSHKRNLMRQYAPGLLGTVVFSGLLLLTSLDLWLWALITLFVSIGVVSTVLKTIEYKVIESVALDEVAITLKGHVKDVAFTAMLPLADTKASLIMLRVSKYSKDFYIRLETADEKHCINLNRHWSYEKLINFYKALKKAQGEPLTFGDKDYLKQMRDRAMGIAQGYDS